MLDFFKKKAPSPAPVGQEALESMESPENKEQVDEKIVINTMPEKYRFSHETVNRAKIIGSVIIVGGILFISAFLFVVYYYIYYKPAHQLIQRPLSAATSTETSIATSTIDMSEATSTSSDISTSTVNTDLAMATTSDFSATSTTGTAATTSDSMAATSTTENTITYLSAVDSDNDGLSDQEEQLLDTDAKKQDSDSDGYSDQSELSKLYNPAGKGKIIDDPKIKKYDNKKWSYSVYYPNGFSTSEMNQAETVIFQATDGQFISIISQNNDKKMTIEEYYENELKLGTIDNSQVVSLSGWEGVKSKDGLVIYMTDQNKKNIYTFSYVPGESKTLVYKNIFQMIFDSFVSLSTAK